MAASQFLVLWRAFMKNIKLFYSRIFLATLCVFLTFSVSAADASKKVQAYADQLFHSQSPIEGNPNGDVNIVDFFDYQCRHCGELSQTLRGLVKKDPNVRVIFKDLPILSSESEFAAKAALAAAKQNKYLQLHNRLMAFDTSFDNAQVLEAAQQVGLDMTRFKHDLNSKAIAQQIDNNLTLSQKLGIRGTPALVIAKNTKNLKGEKAYIIEGALDESEIKDVLRKIRGN